MSGRGSQGQALHEPPPCGASWPRQGKAALYITWHLQNKLEGLENPPAIVAALSLPSFLVGSAALILYFLGLQRGELRLVERKGVVAFNPRLAP